MTSDDRIVPLPRKRKAGGRCPICGAPDAPDHRPFCSPRCAEVDLGRWLKGGYRVPTDEAPAEGELSGEEEA
jgi:hypothetical protein